MRIFRLAAVLLCGVSAAASSQMPIMNTGGGRPSVSPSGTLIAYSAARNGEWDVYVAHPDGSGARRITTIAEKNFVNLGPPTWIGDQVFIWRRENDTTRLWLIDVGDGRPGAERTSVLVAPFDAVQIRPSPDGRRIVFLHGDRRKPKVAVANLDGTGLRDLTDGTMPAINPAWSRDGTRVAFTAVDSASHGEIAVVGADGSGYRVITHFDASEGLPQWADWAPDGSRLVIQAGRYNRTKIEESTAHLWLVDVSTGAATKLAPHSTLSLDETPSWFPDGKRIAFQSNRTGVMHVWTMNADGTNARQVTATPP